MAHVILLLAVLLYIYGVLGYHLFGATDPVHWGSLPAAIWSLFKILTLEGWIEIFDASGARGAWLFYVSFIFIAVFVVVNLFIAVVINNLDRARAELEAQAIRADRSQHEGDALLLRRLDAVRAELADLEDALRKRNDR